MFNHIIEQSSDAPVSRLAINKVDIYSAVVDALAKLEDR
jgi:hypothetical protein